jgi:hypothetical protein
MLGAVAWRLDVVGGCTGSPHPSSSRPIAQGYGVLWDDSIEFLNKIMIATRPPHARLPNN